MLIKGEGSSRLVSGRVIRAAKFAKVGSNRIDKTEIAVAYGRGDGEIMNCTAWRETALQIACLNKGDRVLVAGELKGNEYNGKTYWNLDIDYIAVQGKNGEIVTEQQTLDQFSDVKPEDIPF